MPVTSGWIQVVFTWPPKMSVLPASRAPEAVIHVCRREFQVGGHWVRRVIADRHMKLIRSEPRHTWGKGTPTKTDARLPLH